jgi:hypothetical protein
MLKGGIYISRMGLMKGHNQMNKFCHCPRFEQNIDLSAGEDGGRTLQ